MPYVQKEKIIIGRSELVELPDYNVTHIPARIDTGARTSAIWASNIVESDGKVSFVLLGASSPLYTGKIIDISNYSKIMVASSTGHTEMRYKIPMTVQIHGRRIKTYCTLANRSAQAFPMLIGRNTLTGKFIVDVQRGSRTLDKLDETRYNELQSLL